MEGGRKVEREVLGAGMVEDWMWEMSDAMLEVSLWMKIRKERIEV